MASIVWITIGITLTCGALFCAFLAISFAIRREDKVGTLAGRAPSKACQSARHVAGFHRLRWNSFGPRSGVVTTDQR
jgi:hypothetical protein